MRPDLVPTIVKKYLTNGQYLTTAFEKKAVFLHGTSGGSAQSSWDWWNQTPERVGTPYIIDRDGTIIECFSPKMWAPHLGVKGNNNALDKYSIGVELANWGPLKKVGAKYFAHPGNYTKIEIPKNQVQIYNPSYRGFEAYEKYTQAQLTSLMKLILQLKVEFPSLKAFAQDGFYNYNGLVVSKTLPGIWSHTTVRKDKTDIHPQPELLEVLKVLSTLL